MQHSYAIIINFDMNCKLYRMVAVMLYMKCNLFEIFLHYYYHYFYRLKFFFIIIIMMVYIAINQSINQSISIITMRMDISPINKKTS